tara:strand:+ start:426 stop:620 length:195 start_codon:yes stop_codon:yes gene_type:complete
MVGILRMEITSLKNENGARVYHVYYIEDGCIQEFWSYKEAQDYVKFKAKITKARALHIASLNKD